MRDLLADVDVPVLAGPQSQGNLLAIPTDRHRDGTAVNVPSAGVDIIAPADGGHAHTLVAPDGATVQLCHSADPNDLVLAVVECDAPVYLLHAEHGATGLAAGRWELRGQREYDAAEARRVAD